MDLMQLIRNMQGSQQASVAPNGMDNILKVLGIQGNRQSVNSPGFPSGGNGGGIVATPEQEAMSEELSRRLGVQSPDDILVQGNRGPQDLPPAERDMSDYQMGPPVSLGNNDWIEEGIAWEENRPKRKGMFGMKGTLRDVLGTVGDAFLVQSGNKPVYAPRKEQERSMDAMAGFTQSPLAAVERLVASGRTEEAAKLYDDIQQNKVRTAQMESLNASREDQATTRGQARFEKARAYTSALLNAAGTDPAKLQFALQAAEKAARMAGVSMEDLGIEEDMTPEQLALIADAGMTVNQQEGWPRRDRQLDQGERRIDVSEQQGNRRLDIAQQNANRPRGGSQPRLPTEAAEIARIRGKVNRGEKLAPGDAQTWQTYQNKGSGKSSRTSRRSVTPPGASGNRPRIVNVRDK